jgi:hypothetical protein
MAFSSTNLERMYQNFSNGTGVFLHRSTATHTDIEATGYFENGKRLGMKLGDALMHICGTSTGSSAATWHVVSASTGAVSANSSDSAAAWNQAYNVTVTGATT